MRIAVSIAFTVGVAPSVPVTNLRLCSGEPPLVVGRRSRTSPSPCLTVGHTPPVITAEVTRNGTTMLAAIRTALSGKRALVALNEQAFERGTELSGELADR